MTLLHANHNGLGLNPGEPYFVIRGQDLFAIAIVATWITWAGRAGVNDQKIADAYQCLCDMRSWPGRRKVPD